MVKMHQIAPLTRFKLPVAAALALALGACASMPTPMAARPAEPAAPYDPSAPPHIVAGVAPLQCVPFARRESGVEIYGDAHTWWAQAAGRYPRSSSPAPGSVLVMRGYNNPNRGHVAVVTEVVSSRMIRIDQANWLNHGETSLAVPVLDVSPGNDWSEVRVWYIPGRHWGGRVYQVEGFIHNFQLQAMN